MRVSKFTHEIARLESYKIDGSCTNLISQLSAVSKSISNGTSSVVYQHQQLLSRVIHSTAAAAAAARAVLKTSSLLTLLLAVAVITPVMRLRHLKPAKKREY